jgi:hypothetical protein|tara:strand:+ start:376 stop:867 length:492 start_codon:yes stop_codon:yes gene_type:complete
MTEERLKAMKGKVHIKAWQKQEDGSEIVIKDTTFDNLIVNTGKDSILRRIGGLSSTAEVGGIGVGDSTQVAALSDTDLIAGSNKYWKDTITCDVTYVRPTLFVTVDFGFSQANFTWNEIGLCDNQGSPNSPAGGALMWARQIDASPLVKDTTKRAIIEWQLTL